MLRLLVKADNKAHIETFDELRRNLSDVVGRFDMRALSCDRYYRIGVGREWQSRSIPCYEIPRPSGSLVPVWRDAGRSDTRDYFPLAMKVFDGVLDEFRPHIVILAHDAGHFEVGFLQRCLRRRVPSLIIQEGLIIAEDGSDADDIDSQSAADRAINEQGSFLKRFYQFARYPDREARQRLKNERRRRSGFGAIRPFGLNGASHVAALGPLSAEQLCQRGLSSERVVVTGLPRFDRLWRIASARRADALQSRLGGKPKALFLQFTGLHYGAELATVQNELRVADEVAESLADAVEVVVRLRPEERLTDYEPWWAERFRFARYASTSEDLYAVLPQCAFVIAAVRTTVAVEAAMLDLPVINYDPCGRDSYGFVSSGIALPATDSSGIVTAIRDVSAGGHVARKLARSRQRFFKERVLVDGQAGHRVATFIQAIVREVNSKSGCLPF